MAIVQRVWHSHRLRPFKHPPFKRSHIPVSLKFKIDRFHLMPCPGEKEGSPGRYQGAYGGLVSCGHTWGRPLLQIYDSPLLMTCPTITIHRLQGRHPRLGWLYILAPQPVPTFQSSIGLAERTPVHWRSQADMLLG